VVQVPPTVATIRVPRSSARREQCFAKLLRYVDPRAECGFGFEGKILRPGQLVSEEELYEPGYPPVPILLEYSQGDVSGVRGARRREPLYVLWRYDRVPGEWQEIARAASVSWEWAADLRPIAIRALREARGSVEVLPSLPLIARRISMFLETELTTLEDSDRLKILAVLHDQFACRIAAIL